MSKMDVRGDAGIQYMRARLREVEEEYQALLRYLCHLGGVANHECLTLEDDNTVLVMSNERDDYTRVTFSEGSPVGRLVNMLKEKREVEVRNSCVADWVEVEYGDAIRRLADANSESLTDAANRVIESGLAVEGVA